MKDVRDGIETSCTRNTIWAVGVLLLRKDGIQVYECILQDKEASVEATLSNSTCASYDPATEIQSKQKKYLVCIVSIKLSSFDYSNSNNA